MTIKSGQAILVSTHTTWGRCGTAKLQKFLGQSKGTVLVPGTRRVKRKLPLVILSLEA